MPHRTTTSIDHRSRVYGVVDHHDPYARPLIVKALQQSSDPIIEIVDSFAQLPDRSAAVVQFQAYEALDFDHATEYSGSSLLCAYVIRKALIRKHYLSNTVAIWLVKRPESCLAGHFKAGTHFELDFAEFLDDALVDAWDLNASMERNQDIEPGGQPEWWILKPGMSDGGNGIRLFSTIHELQAIFEAWEDDLDEGNETDTDGQDQTEASATIADGIMTSQLRHFIAQPYIDPPLLLQSYGGRKFHIRAYVVAAGALKVFVYREMLALFAARSYAPPLASTDNSELDLTPHLTNTCFQDASARESSVFRFWSLDDPQLKPGWQDNVFQQICDVTGEIFEAAVREQMVHFQALPNAFEIFGVDFLVDHSHNVWLLELNSYPDFKQTGAELQDTVVGGLFKEIVKVAICPFFGNDHDACGTRTLRSVRDINLGRR